MNAILFEKEFSNKSRNHSRQLIRNDILSSRNSSYLTILTDDFKVKMAKHSEKRREHSRSPHKSFVDEVDEEKSKDYIPFKNKKLHVHCHPDKKLPHLHASGCERVMTAYDRQREKRYYFTNKLTPVRVYIRYDKEVEKKSYNNNSSLNFEAPAYKEGSKMELLNLRNKLGISSKFLKETSTMRFIKETLSFIPITTRFSKASLDMDDSFKTSRSEDVGNSLRKMSTLSESMRKLSIISNKSTIKNK